MRYASYRRLRRTWISTPVCIVCFPGYSHIEDRRLSSDIFSALATPFPIAMRSLAINAVKRFANESTIGILNREDRQMLMSGGFTMTVFLLFGIALMWLVISRPPEAKEISLNFVTQDGGDVPFVWQSTESSAEEVSPATLQANQLETEMSPAEETPARGDLPWLEESIARLLAIESSSTGRTQNQMGEPVPGINDPFNPSTAGLARKGMFQGRTLLAWTNEPYVIKRVFPTDHMVWQALRSMGFDVQLRTGRFKQEYLHGISQLWIFSGLRTGMTSDDYKAVIRFLQDGGGLYLCGDNTPYIAESRRLCSMLFDCEPKGDYFGEQLLGIYDRDGKRRILQGPQGQIQIDKKNWQRRHPLLTGMQCIYEGHTISTLPHSQRLTPVLRASNRRVLAAVSNDHLRVVVDGGFTRYVPEYNVLGTEKGAGTLLWATNIAAYLEGVEHADPRSDNSPVGLGASR